MIKQYGILMAERPTKRGRAAARGGGGAASCAATSCTTASFPEASCSDHACCCCANLGRCYWACAGNPKPMPATISMRGCAAGVAAAGWGTGGHRGAAAAASLASSGSRTRQVALDIALSVWLSSAAATGGRLAVLSCSRCSNSARCAFAGRRPQRRAPAARSPHCCRPGRSPASRAPDPSPHAPPAASAGAWSCRGRRLPPPGRLGPYGRARSRGAGHCLRQALPYGCTGAPEFQGSD